MKIVTETGWKIEQLGDVSDGTLIYYEGDFYIVTNTYDDTSYRECVNVENGILNTFSNSALVSVIEQAVLKVGGARVL